MRYILFALFFVACASTQATEKLITENFIQALKDNAKDKANGSQDPKRFLQKVSEIADKGDPSAQFLWGLVLLNAQPQIAEQYMSSSAKSGCAGSEMALGVLDMINKRFSSGVAHFQKAAALGEASAQVALSGLHQRGDYGVEQNLAKAYAWLRIAEMQTFSAGARRAINEGKDALEKKMSPSQLSNSTEEFNHLSSKVPVVRYYFCGQFDVNNDLARDIPSYYRFQ